MEDIPGWFVDPAYAQGASQGVQEYLTSICRSMGDLSTKESLKLFQCLTWLPENVIQKDRAAVANINKTVVFPLISRQLLQVMFNRDSVNNPNLYGDKNLLRDLISEHGLTEIVERNKQKFKVPVSIWACGEVGEIVSEFAKPEFPGFDIISRERFLQEWNKLKVGVPCNDRAIWGIFVLAEWYKQLCEAISEAHSSASANTSQ